MAGALPRNLSSIKISAPSGSEETVTVPTPSGADDEEIFDESEDSAPSLGFSALACERLACGLSGLLTRGGGEFFGERHGVGIEAMENFEKIGGAEGEAHASDIFLRQRPATDSTVETRQLRE